MSDPLALLPLAMAAHGGRVDDFEAQQLVAAGLTLLQRSAPLVRALSGRRAAILLPTSSRFLVALAACEGRGAVLVNPLAAPAEVAFQLRDANVGAVFTVSALAARLPADVVHVLLDDAPRAATVVADGTAREVDLGSHFGLSLEGDPLTAGRDEECAIVYTSAMAGTPLGAVLTHHNLLTNARATVQAAENVSGDHVLALLPFSHLFGLVVTGVAPLLAGARVTTMERFNPIRAAELLAAGGITEVVGVPAVFGALLAALERRPSGTGTLGDVRLCICGGAYLPPAMQDRWLAVTGTELRQGYGLTEAGPVCLFNRADRPNARGHLGTAFPGVEVTIRQPVPYDANGLPVVPAAAPRELPDGTRGEICVRGDNVFRGYLRGDGAGLPRVGGWLHTGDLGVRVDGGSVIFGGLVKPMFTRNGFNVYPREVEGALRELDGVRDVRVAPLAEPARENDVLVEVSGGVTEADVRAFAEQRLAAYKQPSVVVVK